MKKIGFIIFMLLLVIPDSARCGRGLLYIFDSSKTSGDFDIDTCYTYAENTIRPALDHWLGYYTEYDLAESNPDDVGYFSEFDGLIIAPFTSRLVPDNAQMAMAEAVEDSGVGWFNCDPMIDSLHSSLFELIPIYYKLDNKGNDSLFTNPVYMENDTAAFPYVNYVREKRGSAEPSHWINRFGYAGQKIKHYFPTTDSLEMGDGLTPHFERFYMVDSIESAVYGPYDYPRLKPILIRDTATEYPLIYAGYSPSGKGKIWTLTCPPDWWCSVKDSLANGWARHGTTSDVFWRGLAYIAKGGVALKVLDRYAALVYKDMPFTHSVYDIGAEYIRHQMIEAVISRGIPATCGLYTDPEIGGNYAYEDYEYLRNLYYGHGCRYILQAQNDSVLHWVDHPGANAYTPLTDSSFSGILDSIMSYQGDLGLPIDPVFSAHYSLYDDSDVLFGWLAQKGCRTSVVDHPPKELSHSDTLTRAEYQANLRTGWYPEPFGANYSFADMTTELGGGLFAYSHRNVYMEGILNWDWQTTACALESGLLDSCFANFKTLTASALAMGVPAYIRMHAYQTFCVCNPENDADIAGDYPDADSVYWASVRWDSLMGKIDSFARQKGVKWITLLEALEKTDNLNRYQIGYYNRRDNVFEVALIGSTYAETELTLYYGEGEAKEELPVKIPPFEDSYYFTAVVVNQGGGYYVEIY